MRAVTLQELFGRADTPRIADGRVPLLLHLLSPGGKPLQAFELAGTDRKFYPATARIEHDTILVSAPEVPEPAAVRYAWSNNPDANLFNGTGLPAAPIRSDEW